MASGNFVLQIITKGSCASGSEAYKRPVWNVFNFKRGGVSASPSKSAGVTAFMSAIGTPLLACLSVSYNLDSVDARFLDNHSDPYTTTNPNLPGGISGDSLPSVNAINIQMRCGIRGGGSRGSKHLSPIAESSTRLDSATSGFVTTLGTFMTAWLAGFSDGTYTYLPFIVSSVNSELKYPSELVIGNIVTELKLNPILSTMKKRKQPINP